jgi:hypothetical protein
MRNLIARCPHNDGIGFALDSNRERLFRNELLFFLIFRSEIPGFYD